MIPEIKVVLSYRGSAIPSPQPTEVRVGSGELTSALQVAAQRTNQLLTGLTDSGELSSCTGTAAVGEEEEDSGDDDDESDGLPQPKKKKT